MKKLVHAAAGALLLCLLCGCSAADGTGKMTIAASFYPMYVFAENVAAGVPGAEVVRLTDNDAGCLHDYQLKTRDMAMLEEASALIVNGGGMEPFMDKIAQQRPQLPVIDAGAGIELLCAQEAHDHDAHDHDHDHGAYNAHMWLNPKLAIRQVENIAEGLATADAENAQAYRDNAAKYIARLRALDEEIAALLAPYAGREIVIFHESFAYLADAYGLVVAGVIAGDSGEEPSTRRIAGICDLVKETGVSALIIEPQYPARAAETIARETGAAIYTLDPVVSGDGALNSYETLMRNNAQTLAEALK